MYILISESTSNCFQQGEKALVKFREVPLTPLIVHIRRRQTYFRISEYTALTAAAAAVFPRQVVWIVKYNVKQLLSSAIFIFIHCHCIGLQGRWTVCIFSNTSEFSPESWFTYRSTRLNKYIKREICTEGSGYGPSPFRWQQEPVSYIVHIAATALTLSLWHCLVFGRMKIK